MSKEQIRMITVDRKFLDTSLKQFAKRDALKDGWKRKSESAPAFGSWDEYHHGGKIAFVIHRFGRETSAEINPEFFHDHCLWCPCGSH